MFERTVSGIMLTLLLIGMLTLAFGIQPVKSDWTWTETIYIRADGSVDPPTAPISTVDNITYRLTDNIVGDVPDKSNAIVVERDNIVVLMSRIEGCDDSNGNWAEARTFYVTQDTDACIINSPVVQDLGEVNMGSTAPTIVYAGASYGGVYSCFTEGEKIFDDGIWWIEEDRSEPHLGWMEVYVDGEYKGECSRLDFGHKVEGVNSWPTVVAIYASGYIRLKECREPDVNFGTSFVLGPAYWEGGIYHHHPQIKEAHINTGGASTSLLSLEIIADMEHLNITYNILMSEPTRIAMELDVEQIFEVANPFVLDESRFENYEGFKLVQFSSMYIDDYYHDADRVRYVDETGKLVTVKFQEIGKDRFIFDEPQKLGRNWFECVHSDDEGWQGNTPNCVILLDDPLLATECTPQGWIRDTSDPNDDNVGLWIHFDNASLEWNIGDGNSISYRLIARDNPVCAPNGSWVWVRDTVTGADGEAVVGTGDAIYIAKGTGFYRYTPADNSWTAVAAPPNPDSGDAFKTGTALTWDFGDYVYALYGAATVDSRRWFYRYSISGNSWQALANTPADQGEGDTITYNGTYIYATIGGEQRPTYFVRYDPFTNSWSGEPANPPAGMGDGASLVWTGGDFLYALRGEFYETSALYDFWRYSLTDDVWAAMADIPADPHDGGIGGVGDGGSLLYVGRWLSTYTDYIYALSGNQVRETPDNRTYRYTISMNSWERLADLPFVVGDYVGCRLGYADGHIYAWQGTPGTWEGGGDDLAYYVFPAPEPVYVLEISSTIGGTTDPAPGTYTYSAGTEATVTVTPEENYHVDHWELDGENAGSQNPIAITMDANHTLHAVFQEMKYTLTITTTSGGTTDPTPGEYIYSAGTQVPVSAIPDTNNLFDHWKLDGENAGTTSPIEVLMNSNHTLHATFRLLTYNLTIWTTTGGTTDLEPGTYTYVNGTYASVTAIPDTHFLLDYWLLDGDPAGSDNPTSVLMTDSHTLQPIFLLCNYTLTITATAGGITDLPPGTYTYVANSNISVTAIPDINYILDYWLLDGEERAENPITVTMDANHTLEAVFADDIPPEISLPIQEPPENITAYQNVSVTVNVTDLGTGVYNVTLWYSINNGTTWTPLNMTEISTNKYQATIPGYENCTSVTYKIAAYDNNGNSAINDKYGYYFDYHVIPESPSLIVLSLLMIATLLAVIIYRRRTKTVTF